MNFYLIDKPLNYTSFDVLKVLRSKFEISKIGHTGTLDPLASGCLLVATGNYTKLIPYFEKDKKEYEFTVNFDGFTKSFDLETEVKFLSKEEQKKSAEKISKELLEKLLLENFTGEIFQVPPKYSALKIGGMKALHKVLNGEDFEMKKRKCIIYKIKLLDYKYPSARIIATVSAGTYIRSIANDLGNILGTGGYISGLKRTKIGDLDISFSNNLDLVNKNNYLDIKKLFNKKNFITLDSEILKKINDGIRVRGNFNFKKNTELFVICNNNVTNIVEYDGKILIPRKKI